MKLRSLSRWVCLVIAVAVSQSRVVVANDGLTRVESDHVSLGNGDYWISSEGASSCHLVHGDNEHSARWRLSLSVDESQLDGIAASAAQALRDGHVADIALVRLGNRAKVLCAVVKLNHGDAATFWTFTLPDVAKQDKVEVVDARMSLLVTGQADDQILALSGTRRGTVFTAMIGKMSSTQPAAIATGILLFDGCPSPQPSNARVGRFTTKYEPMPYDLEVTK